MLLRTHGGLQRALGTTAVVMHGDAPHASGEDAVPHFML